MSNHSRNSRRPPAAASFLTLLSLAFLTSSPVRAALDEPGFRAVGVAYARYPISAIAVAPDGRLFAAVQALGQQSDPDVPGTAEIRVYGGYSTSDAAANLDPGVVWATVENVRATSSEEGILGIALAPDFATSKLVYIHVVTTDEDNNQHIRVYRENASGVGEFLGTVKETLEPPTESATRSGGQLTFGPDNCLYVGVGDNGQGSRWNAQVLTDTDNFSGAETTQLCQNVCNGTAENPQRQGTDLDGELNFAGKVLRMAVSGGSPAQPPPAPAFTGNQWIFGTGLRNPSGLFAHPLTGQLYVTDRADTLQAEISVVDPGSNLGWPCIEGSAVNGGAAACINGQNPSNVYSRHPNWRRPIVAHAQNGLVLTGMAAYTGLAYPESFYGDVFYLLRDGARIYRLDLGPPCFLPGSEIAPLIFHDSANDGDFTAFAVYDRNDNGESDGGDNINAQNLWDIAQGPDPQGSKVLYVLGRENNNDLQSDSVIFRIEYTSLVAPYSGPAGRVADACFGSGPNPFQRVACALPGGSNCEGQPDGTPCDDGDVCNGAETCQGGACQHGTTAPDGTACTASGNRCLSPGSCQGGGCVAGPPLPDGSPCPDNDACNGLETCAGAVCQPATSGPLPLAVQTLSVRGKGSLSLSGGIQPALAIDPKNTDNVSLRLDAAGATVFQSDLLHPGTDGQWKAKKGSFKYRDGRGRAGGLTLLQLRSKGANTSVKAKGHDKNLKSVSEGGLAARLVIGNQCFTADVACAKRGRSLFCNP